MKRYEYRRLTFGRTIIPSDLTDLDNLGSRGWRVVVILPDPTADGVLFALLERESQ